MGKTSQQKWEFKPRFRRHAFGWRSQRAIRRIRQAVGEIKQVAQTDPVLGAEGAVTHIERLSPGLENVDSSSGAIGSAVYSALAQLAPLIAEAPAAMPARDEWLERLWQAHADDQIPYIESLGEHWGVLCGSKERASAWADEHLDIVKLAWSPDPNLRGHFHGTTAVLSALFRAERYAELVELVQMNGASKIWPYQEWGVRALAAQGKKAEAIQYAESCRGKWTSDFAVDQVCEEILLSSGLVEEAYQRYAIGATRAGTKLATFRALARKYPQKSAGELLADLVGSTPGEEGKWFAAAKEAGLFDEALALANRTPTDPRTLTRAARDHAETRPAFAVSAGLAALRWLVEGYGYEVTGADVWAAYASTMKAAKAAGRADETRSRIRELVAQERSGFVQRVLGQELGLP